MARYKHLESGVVVSVRDDKSLGAEWEPVDDRPAKPASKASTARSASAKSEK